MRALSGVGLRACATFELRRRGEPRAAWRLIRSRFPLAEPEGSLAYVFEYADGDIRKVGRLRNKGGPKGPAY